MPISSLAKSIGVSEKKSFRENLSQIFSYIQSDYEPRKAESKQLTEWVINGEFSKIEKFLGNVKLNLASDEDKSSIPGDLDMHRHPSKALNKNGRIIATGCRIRALLVGELLLKGGINPENVQILETVTEEDFKEICPSQGKQATSFSELLKKKVGMAGHTYLLVNVPPSGWRVFNPSYPLDSEENLKGNGFPFHSPAEINNAANPILLPADANPWFKSWGEIRAFSSQRIDRVDYYRYRNRNNFIASGSPNNPRCKWALPSYKPKSLTEQSTVK